jgi:hypothetical protein
MSIVTIGTDNYDSHLLSNTSKALLIELAELDIKISQLQQELADSIYMREQLSCLALDAIESAKVD